MEEGKGGGGGGGGRRGGGRKRVGRFRSYAGQPIKMWRSATK